MKRYVVRWGRLVAVVLAFGMLLHSAALAQAVAPAVSGRIVDSATGAALPGDVAPFARAELLRCNTAGCTESVNVVAADNAGAFVFAADLNGAPLTVGTYQVVASASAYTPQTTEPFSVTADTEVRLNDIALAPTVAGGSISGRLVDAKTGAALPGDATPFASAALIRCTVEGCFENIAYQQADSSGHFEFTSDYFGAPLTAGTYVVQGYAYGYEYTQTETFDFTEGTNYDTGDIALSTTPAAESISGQVVDADTGQPLRGDVAPFTQVTLLYCSEFEGCYPFTTQATDSTGHFSFTFELLGIPLPVGQYQLSVTAADYQSLVTAPFFVGDGEAYDAGVLGLKPQPIRISELRPCGNLPHEGGTCIYSFRITNLTKQRLDGATWSIVNSDGISSTLNYTFFQAGEPQNIALAPGASQVFWFQFRVPSTVADNTIICAYAFVGEGLTDPFFNTIAERNLFCIQKGYTGLFTVLPAQPAQHPIQHPGQNAAPLGRPKLQPHRLPGRTAH
ncbi:hypothetical protein SE17_20060 [Kouleothrix aurantiaca]|uniref:Carboxypeptidase regulatory-like domain-containing protein n=1 Tax=Kouleothrix aurantiaca TaxID=186479 RepID=A0A0P9CYU6_9CHLR|nr:hypothetical protein SE17_20060 [Kouleothrix aurantiaca]